MGVSKVSKPMRTLRNAYILTLCDNFTKWSEAVSLPAKEASGIASALLYVMHSFSFSLCTNYVYEDGTTCCDQRSKFKNQLNDEMMKILNIQNQDNYLQCRVGGCLEDQYQNAVQVC